jgi:hypothetical protein
MVDKGQKVACKGHENNYIRKGPKLCLNNFGPCILYSSLTCQPVKSPTYLPLNSLFFNHPFINAVNAINPINLPFPLIPKRTRRHTRLLLKEMIKMRRFFKTQAITDLGDIPVSVF